MQIIEYKKGGYLHNYVIDYAKKVKRNRLVIDAFTIFCLLLLTLFLFIVHKSQTYIIIFGVFSLLICIWWCINDLRKILKKANKELFQYQKGEDGEKEVLEYLKQKFDDSWFYINNLEIPELKIGDIDGILIGPKGIFILEIKNWSGSFRISGSDFYRHLYKDRYQLYSHRPVEQVANNAKIFLEYLDSKKETQVSVIPTVVLVNSHVEYISRPQKTTVTELNQLANAINNVNSMNLTPAYIKRLIGILVYNKCPRCGGDLVRHQGKNYSDFWGCSNYKNGCLFKEEIIQAGH